MAFSLAIRNFHINTLLSPVLRRLEIAAPWRKQITSPLELTNQNLRKNEPSFLEELFGGIFNIKRTFQPSLIRRKRKHGFLARNADKDGRTIMHRRRQAGRKSLCA